MLQHEPHDTLMPGTVEGITDEFDAGCLGHIAVNTVCQILFDYTHPRTRALSYSNNSNNNISPFSPVPTPDVQSQAQRTRYCASATTCKIISFACPTPSLVPVIEIASPLP